MLIAITGKAGAGKDTAASILVKSHKFHALPFAEALKESCMFKFGLSHDDVFTQEGKKRYVPTWGMTVGEILQKEGTEATKPFWGEDFWLRRWCMTYDAMLEGGMTNIVVTDCRFPIEAEGVISLGGKIVEIVRPNAPALEGRDPNHVSEQGLDKRYIHATIVNEGSQSDLRKKMLDLYEGWKHD